MNNSYSLLIAGDILPSIKNVHSFQKGDISALFDEKIQELFRSADYSIVNLEGPLTNAGVKQTKVGPVLKAPIDSVNGLKSLGVSCVALANNHFTDYLLPGCLDTLNSLESAGIQHIGGGINSNSINPYTSVFLGERRVCLYNVSEAFFNIPSKTHPGVNVYDEYVVCNDIKELKKSHDYLIVVYHGGAEMCPYPTPNVRKRFYRMADCGADFITAQHTHCIGCEEYYKGSFLLYGQGNFFLDHMRNPISRRGLITKICFLNDSIRIDHYVVRTESGKVIVDSDQGLESFRKRSEEILNEEIAKNRYADFIRSNMDLKYKYYQAYKGRFIGGRLLRRFLPQMLLRSIEVSYGKAELERIVFSLESDRMREDVLCLWEQLKKTKYERG